jgi:hypothetical protein
LVQRVIAEKLARMRAQNRSDPDWPPQKALMV